MLIIKKKIGYSVLARLTQLNPTCLTQLMIRWTTKFDRKWVINGTDLGWKILKI